MPYTPPSQRSPALSPCSSPNAGRGPLPARRASLPRSSSYARNHQRKSSVTDASSGTLTPRGTSEDLPSLASSAVAVAAQQQQQRPSALMPWTDDLIMPHGAVISPPDSASSSSDDEATLPHIRGRQSAKAKGLKTAVTHLPHAKPPPSYPHPQQQRQQSHATASRDASKSQSNEGDTRKNMHLSLSLAALDDTASRHRPRKVSHVRSATEPNAIVTQSSTENTSDDENGVDIDNPDEATASKPPMVRKKSGELVRPALRPSSRRRPSSMPGTPVSSKAVHFDSHLEHIRHFLQVDRPLAVSAGSSPVEAYQNEAEYPFPGASRSPPFEWEISTPNFPQNGTSRAALPVKLEKLWLSPDQKSLLGYVAVANLAFQKHVSCRFTLDSWKTTSEVTAEYCHEIRPCETSVPHDRFSFSIKLSDTANLESKTLYLCVRYSVNSQEFWDNNAAANFQVDFRKKHLPQNGKNNFNGTAGRSLRNSPLPRSNHRSSASCGDSSTVVRSSPSVEPQQVHDHSRETEYGHSLRHYLGDSDNGPGLRLRSKSSQDIAGDRLDMGLSSPRGVAFSNRYDFGASLSAAVQAARDTMSRDKDTLYLQDNIRPSSTVNNDKNKKPVLVIDAASSPSSGGARTTTSTLPSTSYEELVNKYCFALPATRAKPDRNSPTQDGKALSVEHHGPEPAATACTTNTTPTGFGVSDAPFGPQIPERFSWRGDTHSTPTIRG
ncbi:putative phosphatase regulatory subunit [Geosmithia morbida]|uniref:Phosphatase regulatory subunit n=1 Tax=Geosmithia morbida TaxID=1094350 RepID=A0A9P5D0G1_9HYPO|nr:putative phosphatase regulatory subunit [Geosmithia morbida]KAF4119416.1 putative phosphatase regulatory subunit [Geosmithia morbida]